MVLGAVAVTKVVTTATEATAGLLVVMTVAEETAAADSATALAAVIEGMGEEMAAAVVKDEAVVVVVSMVVVALREVSRGNPRRTQQALYSPPYRSPGHCEAKFSEQEGGEKVLGNARVLRVIRHEHSPIAKIKRRCTWACSLALLLCRGCRESCSRAYGVDRWLMPTIKRWIGRGDCTACSFQLIDHC